ncbi:unnamed protein product [Merluccius merluccius]
MNGGVCVHKDRCLCPSSFTGKFCQLPAPQPGPAPSPGANQLLTRSKFLLPLQSRPAAEKQKQVLESQQSQAGPPAPAGLRVQGQTLRGDGTYTQHSGFKYCFRNVSDKKRVISEERSQCYRVLGPGSGPSSCSLPILKNITKQICCCSRVGKAWGANCQRCPYYASVEFKDICPAGPGYHYSASALQFHQRSTGSAQLVTPGNQDKQDKESSVTNVQTQGSNTGTHTCSCTSILFSRKDVLLGLS